MLEVFFELFPRARTQTFIIFGIPAGGHDRAGELFLPVVELAIIVEQDLLRPAAGFQNRSIHKPDETRNLRK